jgi:hypothetical protein
VGVKRSKVAETEETQQTYQEIKITFPDSVSENVIFENRDKDDLPEGIKGKAKWFKPKDPRRAVYTIPSQNRKGLIAVEFINDAWYQLYGDGQDKKWKTAREDRINPTSTV